MPPAGTEAVGASPIRDNAENPADKAHSIRSRKRPEPASRDTALANIRFNGSDTQKAGIVCDALFAPRWGRLQGSLGYGRIECPRKSCVNSAENTNTSSLSNYGLSNVAFHLPHGAFFLRFWQKPIQVRLDRSIFAPLVTTFEISCHCKRTSTEKRPLENAHSSASVVRLGRRIPSLF